MKIHSLFIASIISLFSCNYEEQNVSAALINISENINPTQGYEISPARDTVLIGSLGTKIFIKANSLIFDDGELASRSIALNLKEVYSKSDMILNGLTTLSDGNLLESSGMINITASSEGRNLKLIRGLPIRIQFNKNSEKTMMRTYLGVSDSTKINWVLDTENIYDTLYYNSIIESIAILDIGRDSVFMEKVLYEIVGSDTSEINRMPWIEESDSTFIYQPFYALHTTNLGWINCDYFIKSDDNTNVLVSKIDNFKTLNFLVFKNINSIMDSWEDDKNNTIFRNVPRGSQVTILSIGLKESEYLYAIKDVVIEQTNQQITLEYKSSNLEEIGEKIKKSF